MSPPLLMSMYPSPSASHFAKIAATPPITFTAPRLCHGSASTAPCSSARDRRRSRSASRCLEAHAITDGRETGQEEGAGGSEERCQAARQASTVARKR